MTFPDAGCCSGSVFFFLEKLDHPVESYFRWYSEITKHPTDVKYQPAYTLRTVLQSIHRQCSSSWHLNPRRCSTITSVQLANGSHNWARRTKTVETTERYQTGTMISFVSLCCVCHVCMRSLGMCECAGMFRGGLVLVPCRRTDSLPHSCSPAWFKQTSHTRHCILCLALTVWTCPVSAETHIPRHRVREHPEGSSQPFPWHNAVLLCWVLNHSLINYSIWPFFVNDQEE